MSYEALKQFSVTLEECLFRMPVHRDRALNYKMEEVQITVVDEIYVEQNALGHVEKQIARVRLFFLGFLSGEKTRKQKKCFYLIIFHSFFCFQFYKIRRSLKSN